MVKRLIIHGGMHKTGTSALQKALLGSPCAAKIYDQDSLLARHDLSVFYAILEADEHLTYTLTKQPEKVMSLLDPVSLVSNSKQQVIRELTKQQDLLFMTGEAFLNLRPNHISRLLNFVHTYVNDVEFVFYVRTPYQYACSMYAQLVSSGMPVDLFSVTPKYHRLDNFPDAHLIKYENVDSTVRDFSNRYGIELTDTIENTRQYAETEIAKQLVTNDDLDWAKTFWSQDECPEIFGSRV